ncbi:Uma2 family endonuclease [Desulfonema magnum]|uniref:DUF820 n=1 Tax=Desulfonema magnum TaxID=45655 RepID=A0A975BV38_9BACT|nr:Uma2 family endonuclease [Desulfonema magnum]QTA92311.1 DUF820 [Desulfonema magnum]
MYKDHFTDSTRQMRLRFYPAITLTDDQFYDFCQINRELRIEKTDKGDMLIMSPTGGETSRRNSELIIELGNWAKKDKTGVVFDSSGGFVLPNGATRSPDAAWVTRSRLAGLTRKQKEKFIPLCPDFVIELRSSSDSLSILQEKMQEYMDNGAKLGWLIDPVQKKIFIYRPDRDPECLENPKEISGESVLPKFILALDEIWEPKF